MVLPCSTEDREHNKFLEDQKGKVTSRVQDPSGGILQGVIYDDAELTATTSTTDTWTFRCDSTDVATLLITYTDSTKDCVSRVQKTVL